MPRSRFDFEVDTAIARRKPCPECGGKYVERWGRPYHAYTCSRNPIHRSRFRYSDTAQERHDAGLISEVCRHGYGDDWTRCPACTEEADRAWKERHEDI